MNDKQFYEECVKRLIPPIHTKTERELVSIVLLNTRMNKEHMFSTADIHDLLQKTNDNLFAHAYNFIRDNQDLYINDNNMNREQISQILDDKNVLNILPTISFSSADSQQILDYAIYCGKIEVGMHFMKKGFMPRIDTAFFLSTLVKDSKYDSILNYLYKQNIDLFNVANGALIVVAANNNNSIALEKLLKNAPYDCYVVKKCLINYINDQYENKPSNQRIKSMLPKIATQMTTVTSILMNKLSLESSNDIISQVKQEEIKQMLEQQYFMLSLDRKLPIKDNNIKKYKI